MPQLTKRKSNNISTHTPHARRDVVRRLLTHFRHISTHTPHARRDINLLDNELLRINFNSHASCEA